MRKHRERVFVCQHADCNQKFKRQSELDYHTKALHLGTQNKVCNHCNIEFPLSSYYRHLKKINNIDNE